MMMSIMRERVSALRVVVNVEVFLGVDDWGGGVC